MVDGLVVLGSLHAEMTALLDDRQASLFNRTTDTLELGHLRTGAHYAFDFFAVAKLHLGHIEGALTDVERSMKDNAYLPEPRPTPHAIVQSCLRKPTEAIP